MPFFTHMEGQIFASNPVVVFLTVKKNEFFFFVAHSTAYIVEQDFSKVLYIRYKYRNLFHINNTAKNALPLRLTN